MKSFIVAIIALLATLSAAPSYAQNSDIYSNNIVLVFDDSGSMDYRMRSTRDRRIDVAKSAILQVLRQTPEGTNVGIVTFSQGVVYPLSAIDMSRIENAIQSIQPRGGTPLGEFMKNGADILLEQRAKQFGYGSYTLVVVTDGEAGDQRLVDEFAPEIVARGIILDVIGLDMDQDHTLATVANSYRRGNDPASLKEAVSEVFAEVGGADPDAVSTEEAFAELSGFPETAARALVGAFRVTGNHPIGEEPPVSDSSVLQPSASTTAAPSSNSAVGTVLMITGFITVLLLAFFFIAILSERI